MPTRTGRPPGRTDEKEWATYGQALALVLHGRTVRSAGPIALVVGTLLASVNQRARIVQGEAGTGTWLRVAFDYLVPFVVASLGWLSARKAER